VDFATGVVVVPDAGIEWVLQTFLGSQITTRTCMDTLLKDSLADNGEAAEE
jgi:hypothetical protein